MGNTQAEQESNKAAQEAEASARALVENLLRIIEQARGELDTRKLYQAGSHERQKLKLD